ncbi:MAG: MBOAT family protein [Lachnospiraceae bacterium]|nr:MBOAT family protein [Lachnospiraceae bacterium]
MIFSSLFFICVFLPVTLILYYVVPKKFKNLILLIMSLIFYAWGEPVYILLMMFSIVFNYLSARSIAYYIDENKKALKIIAFIFNIIINLGLLCFFKYYGFAVENINGLFHTALQIRSIALPVGISFYTFQTLSYVIDVYKGNVPVQKNIINFGAYISMFPQLIAGPIVRYADIETQLNNRELSLDMISEGAAWFIIGMAKKVLLANNVGMLFDTIFATSPDRAVLSTWIGIIAYTFQIYFDFSGYSDMAIGLGKMLGFEFVQNFDYPYISRSATEFWRRWHISLGTWFREYVYIPLGGNRVGPLKHIRNIMIVWLLTGFWHGAAWCFILWGLYYGILLLLEKYIWGKGLAKLPKFIQHIYTIIIFIIGWLIFTSTDLSSLGGNFLSMFGLTGNSFIDASTLFYLRNNIILLVICGICSTPVVTKLFTKIASRKGIGFQIIGVVVYAAIFILSIAYLVNATYNPFLYFRF